jgi:site-specific DNA recombinase
MPSVPKSKNGRSSKSLLDAATDALYAEYGRTSTDEQVDAGTIQNQRDFLSNYRDLYKLPCTGQYYDDGVSGTVPLGERPEGRRLLEDARAGKFKVLLVYRLDRLGRNLKSLLDALEELDACGVTIRSATEPFDTSTAIGRFMFQLLGSLAELERATIAERTTGGRDRVARAGRYTGGPIPIGFDVDEQGYYALTDRVMPVLDQRETEFVADFFARIADRETTLNAERTRLSTLRVPHVSRYGGKKRRAIEKCTNWSINNLASIIHNPIYKGSGKIESRNGTVERPVPALVDATTWERAQAALIANRTLAKRNAKHDYLLRGLVRCTNCGGSYTGTSSGRLYRCTNMPRAVKADLAERCVGADVSAHLLEAKVWAEVKAFVHDPGDAVEGAQAALRARLDGSAARAEQARTLTIELAEKERERERVRTLYRRGKITDAEAEADLDTIASETADIRAQLDTLRVRDDLATAQEAYLSEIGAALLAMREKVELIEAADDRAAKRRLIELLAPRLEIETELVEPAGTVRPDGRVRKRAVKRATLLVTLALRAKPSKIAIDSNTRTPGGPR